MTKETFRRDLERLMQIECEKRLEHILRVEKAFDFLEKESNGRKTCLYAGQECQIEMKYFTFPECYIILLPPNADVDLGSGYGRSHKIQF